MVNGPLDVSEIARDSMERKRFVRPFSSQEGYRKKMLQPLFEYLDSLEIS